MMQDPIGPDGDGCRAFPCRQEIYPYIVTQHAPERFADEAFESSVLWIRPCWIISLERDPKLRDDLLMALVRQAIP